MSWTLNKMAIHPKIIRQSALSLKPGLRNQELVLEICKATNTKVYLSGAGALQYMSIPDFISEGIDVKVQRFNHPQYSQPWSAQFVPGLAILDPLFHIGADATRELLESVPWAVDQENGDKTINGGAQNVF